jgi:hypothetical protein
MQALKHAQLVRIKAIGAQTKMLRPKADPSRLRKLGSRFLDNLLAALAGFSV